MDESDTNLGLSRRAVIKKVLAAGAYTAPVAISVALPEGVAAATPPPVTADLAVTKTVDNSSPIVGSPVTFTVTVANNGPNAATGVLVNDGLPAGLTFVSATPSQGTYSSATGIWTIGSLAVGQRVTLALVATATGPVGTARTNIATVTSTTTDPNPANNSASATVTSQTAPTADIAVTKTVDNATPIVGTNVIFTVTATNNGPSAATGVIVNDALPAGLTLVSATPTAGAYSGGVWMIGAMAVGQAATLTLMATATGPIGTARTNTATLTASSPADPNVANNSASATVTPQAAPTADIAVTKTVDNATPFSGAPITFTVTVTNNGPNAATGVAVSDPVPAGLSSPIVTPATGTYNSVTSVWTIGALAVGQMATLTMSGIVGFTPVTNTATVTASNPTDPNAANNIASATATPLPG